MCESARIGRKPFVAISYGQTWEALAGVGNKRNAFQGLR